MLSSDVSDGKMVGVVLDAPGAAALREPRAIGMSTFLVAGDERKNARSTNIGTEVAVYVRLRGL